MSINFRRASACLAVAATILISAPSTAAPITYTLDGDFTASIFFGGSVTGHGTVVGKGDTGTLYNGGWFKSIFLNSVVITIDGQEFDSLETNGIFVNPGLSAMGFQVYATQDYLDFDTPDFGSYDLVSDFGPHAVGHAYLGYLKTDKGYLNFDSADNLSFSAALRPAVPEPASWMMMLAGFAAIGTIFRGARSRKLSFG